MGENHDEEPEFDAEDLFDENYLHFYAATLTDDLSDQQTEFLWRLLDLRPGSAVLDLACGHGRIANRLAERGCSVTGLDSSATFLRHARADAAERGVHVDYVEGDMRELPWTEQFDAVLNWFTAFGYFSDQGNRQVLTEVHRALRPGGRFVVELNNIVGLLPRYQEYTVSESGNDLMIDRHRLDPVTMRTHVQRIAIRDGQVRRIPYSVRFFTAPELRDWLHAAGFTDVSYVGEDGEPLMPEHRRMVGLASR